MMFMLIWTFTFVVSHTVMSSNVTFFPWLVWVVIDKGIVQSMSKGVFLALPLAILIESDNLSEYSQSCRNKIMAELLSIICFHFYKFHVDPKGSIFFFNYDQFFQNWIQSEKVQQSHMQIVTLCYICTTHITNVTCYL